MAINEKSQKFWCGENDKVTKWGVRGDGVWGRMREYGKFRGVWRSMDGGGIGEFLVVWGVGSSMGNMVGVRKCGRRSGEMCWGMEKR